MDRSLQQACEKVVDALRAQVPMAFWSVSRRVGGRQVYVHVVDDAYGKAPGESHAWTDSFCQFMVTGEAPRFAHDAMAVPQYATAGVARELAIGSYIGVPIHHADGSLYGTLCGLDPEVGDPDLARHGPLLDVMVTLLEEVLRTSDLRTELGVQAARLRQQPRDPLTGLPGRAAFIDDVRKALAGHSGTEPAPSVISVHVDDLRAVNESLGLVAGDQLLIGVAGRISALLPAEALLARTGGDEFAVLLSDADPVHTGETMIAELQRPIALGSGELTVRASVGVAQLGDVPTADALLAHAAVAVQTARARDTARLASYLPGMSVPDAWDVRLRDPLRAAMEDGAIELHYQPIVDLHDSSALMFEALARWTHQGSSVSPAVFIPIAARAGLLPALTDQLLDAACAQVARWSTQAGHDRIQVGVNISPDALGDPDFPDHVAGCVARHGLRPGQLVLEITEDALVADIAAAVTATRRLREMGVVLSLDDFGTGYSSLVHLRQIPLHSLKIDQAFTRELDTDPATEQFMAALLTLGRELGLEVIVEGVERDSQAAILRRLGCRYAQGWHFARPAPAADIDLDSSAA